MENSDLINTLRSLFTVLGLLCFLGIVYWAYRSAHAQKGFDEAAQLPFSDDDDAAHDTRAANQRKEG